MRVVYFGSGALGLPTLQWLAGSGYEVAAVVTQPVRPAGRGRRPMPTPVHELSVSLGFDVVEATDVNVPEFVERISACGAVVGLVIAFGQKLRQPLREVFSAGCVNLHASLLPRYRGAAPINWAIINGEERTGVTVFRLVDRMDAGPILLSRWTYIRPEETAGELHDRLAAVGVDAVSAAMALFKDGAGPPGEMQDETQATTAPKLGKADGFIRFDQPAKTVLNRIRGVTPWPGATVRYVGRDREETMLIVRARVAECRDAPVQPPGWLDERLYAATSDAFVELLEVKPAGGKVMTWQAFVNGRRVQPGDRLMLPLPDGPSGDAPGDR